MEDDIGAEMLKLFRAELELCKVHEGEVVAVLGAAGERQDYVQAFMAAAESLGARSFHVAVLQREAAAAGVQGRHPLSGNATALAALQSADMVIDLLGLLFSKEQARIQAAGTRILRVMEPLHVLRQMFPTVDLRRRTEKAMALLAAGRELVIRSDSGTEVRYGLSQYAAMCEYGYTDEPGRWDHFPSGFAFTHGNDADVEGTVVLAPGDILAAFKMYIHSPVRLTVDRGFISRIDGDGLEAHLIREYMASFRDPRAYAVSHIGWGLNERARWDHLAVTRHVHSEHVMNSLSFAGNVLFSTGPNTELGGTNDTACHLDIPLRGCDLWLDGTRILEGGEIVHPAMQAGPPGDER